MAHQNTRMADLRTLTRALTPAQFSTVALKKSIEAKFHQRVAFAGFGLALLLLFVNSLLPWIFAGFPFWVFVISVCLLVDEHRRRPQASLAG